MTSPLPPQAVADVPALSRAAVDRAGQRRGDREWLAQAWDGGLLLLVDGDGKAGVVETGTGPGLLLVPAAQTGSAEGAWLLGVDEATGTPLWGRAGEPPRQAGARRLGLREVGAELGPRDAGLLVTAVALANWHATHPRCPRCGGPTETVAAGWQRRCPADGTDHFPRTDPAVIVLVHDGADSCLLGRQPTWPPGRYSTLAGFVEPGEAAEAAVRREVAEESGVAVAEIRYRGSQPWPFPASLMLGFEARAVGGRARTADDELEAVGWFSRAELRAGRVRLPPPASIAHWLITGWLARA